MNRLIQIKELSAGYTNKMVLKDINLNVYKDDFLGIIGPNGGGKTTLLRVILGLLSPATGSVTYLRDAQPVSKIKIGYLPQMNDIDKRFPISVYDVVSSGLLKEKPRWKHFTSEQHARITEILEMMGLNDLQNRAIGDLSGGQLQRVLLGRAMVCKPEVLILDEPNSYVDKRFESLFYKLLEDINKESAIILVSHDVGSVVRMVKNIVCVNETAHYHKASDVTNEWLSHHTSCPIELIGHGDLPHRVLQTHGISEHDHSSSHHKCCNHE